MTQTLAPPETARFPLHPPARFFDRPEWLDPGQKLAVVADGPDAGRVAGYVATWDTCIIEGGSECWTPPSSPTAYRGAMQGETLTAEGDLIPTANIGGGVNHARLSEGFQGAVKHYENVAAQNLRVQFGEDDHGIWFAGAAWPELSTEREVAGLRASAVSGDWRYRPELGAVDMAGVQLVNNPALPLVRRVRSAALGQGLDFVPEVFVGGLGGAGDFAPELPPATDADRIHDLEVMVAALTEIVGPEVVRAALAR